MDFESFIKKFKDDDNPVSDFVNCWFEHSDRPHVTRKRDLLKYLREKDANGYVIMIAHRLFDMYRLYPLYERENMKIYAYGIDFFNAIGNKEKDGIQRTKKV